MVLRLDLLWPELLVAGAGLAVILTDLVLPPGRRARPTALAAGMGLLAALLVIVFGGKTGHALAVADAADPTRFVTSWRSDSFSLFARGLTALGGLMLVLLSLPYARRMDRGHGELYGLLLFALLGAMLVAGVQDLLSLFVCLELVTISSYILVALRRTDVRSTEAGLKYLLVGAVSTAILLLGIAFLYGATGSVSFPDLARAAAGSPTPLLVAGWVLLLAGMLFKVGGVPFHVWIPDVYQGAPAPVTAFLSTASKTAGVVLLLRLTEAVFLPAAGIAGGVPWPAVLGVIAGATMLFGVLGAMAQRSMQRMLGYSSIAHAGYLLMGVAAAAVGGVEVARAATAAILFYLAAFVLTNLTMFAAIVLVQASGAGATYVGLARRSPFVALAMLLALLSLAGVPPLSGFFGKFLVLQPVVSAAASGAAGPGFYALAFVGAAGVDVSLYFYLGWIAQMYFGAPPHAAGDGGADAGATRVAVGPVSVVVLLFGIGSMLGMGIFMGPLFDWARTAAESIVRLG
jgi:NADH-quinone oxidoreductase subunit N